MNMTEIKLKMGTIIAIAAASREKENSAGTPQTAPSELAPMNVGINLIRIRKAGQGSCTNRTSESRGTSIASRLIRRRDR